MSTLLGNRTQSAHPRSIHRSATPVQTSHIKQSPTITTNTEPSPVTKLNVPAWRTLQSPTPSNTIDSYQRATTASVDTTINKHLSAEKRRSDEIESLLQCVDRDDTVIVQVDCLANYRKLVQTIDLRYTPLQLKLLCTLQQRENRIVQRNACRDTRFRSLMEVLHPSHVVGAQQINPSGYRMDYLRDKIFSSNCGI